MILVVGLGSMGKRRIRCLQALGYKDIVGFDPREDRKQFAADTYAIKVTSDTLVTGDDTVFICCPPKYHAYYATAVKECKTFIEAGTELLEYGTPSATMLFNPLVKQIQEELPSIGKLVNISYHCGQYLPDWHPYEKVSDFYAGEVGAAEMVAFELMWITKVFGPPSNCYSSKRNTTDIEGLTGPDSVVFTMQSNNNWHGSVLIDVVSRKPIRQLVINGTEKQLRFDLNEGVSEQMYVDEVRAFMENNYPNTLDHSNKVIEITKRLCA